MPAGGIHIGKKCVTGGVFDCKQESVHSRDRGGREEAEPGEELGGGEPVLAVGERWAGVGTSHA